MQTNAGIERTETQIREVIVRSEYNRFYSSYRVSSEDVHYFGDDKNWYVKAQDVQPQKREVVYYANGAIEERTSWKNYGPVVIKYLTGTFLG